MPTNNFTLIRLVLATLVMFGHFKVLQGITSIEFLYDYADFAVDAFFIVSGYLVYGSYENSVKMGDSHRIGSFYIRRLFRIYPLYVIIILAQMLAMLVLLGDKAQLGETIKYLGSNLIFANFLAPEMGGLFLGLDNSAINPSLWTLKIEVAFYLLVPFLWWLVDRKKTVGTGIGILLLIYILSTIFALVTLHYGAETLSKQFPAQMRFFVVGILLYKYRDKFNISFPAAIIIASVAFALCSFRNELPIIPIYPLLIGAIIFTCALRLPAVPLKYDISYGVYLIHAPLIQIALLLGLLQDSAVFLLLLVAVVYSLAFLAEKIIEIPMVKYGKKLSDRFSQKLVKP